MPEMTTIDRASMITWLTPAMMVGIASGSWIWRRMRPSEDPKACPASTTSRSTWRRPSSVIRTPGAIAKMTVATMPGTTPTRKITTVGMRYTNAGMVCMKSSTGRSTRDTPSLRAAQMPSGIATTRATALARITSARVSIALPHWFTPAMTSRPTSVPTASFQPFANRAISASTTAMIQNGGPLSTVSRPS
jgi:hypothetical protein